VQTSAAIAKGAARAWEELGRPGSGIGPLRDLDPVAVEMAQYFWYCDSSRARSELDWRPRPVHETLEDTVRFLQSM
jgi:nucleoside-diphosphate-sugar epimerase